MQRIDGGVNAPKGYEASGIEAGIKYENRKDMALVFSTEPANAAGTFTTNVVKAAPVQWDKEIVESGHHVRAVVLNSGIANAATGKEGKEYNYEMASEIAKVLGIVPEEVLTASTGVIGMQLRMAPIRKGAPLLKDALTTDRQGAKDAARAIMTTDTILKECAVTFEQDGSTITVGGMSKGSGMIHPNMATTLSFITTDAAISPEYLQRALSDVVKTTLNMVSVDGDQSTNDMCCVMANGLSGIDEIYSENESFAVFENALYVVMVNLARMMARDGEGATKLIECVCAGADDIKTAKTIAKSVITSSLFKAAMFGEDANWGRILCAVGYADADFDINKVDVYLASNAGKIAVCKSGAGVDFSEDEAKKILMEEEITVFINIGNGECSAAAWGCDLTYDYVKINGDYRS